MRRHVDHVGEVDLGDILPRGNHHRTGVDPRSEDQGAPDLVAEGVDLDDPGLHVPGRRERLGMAGRIAMILGLLAVCGSAATWGTVFTGPQAMSAFSRAASHSVEVRARKMPTRISSSSL